MLSQANCLHTQNPKYKVTYMGPRRNPGPVYYLQIFLFQFWSISCQNYFYILLYYFYFIFSDPSNSLGTRAFPFYVCYSCSYWFDVKTWRIFLIFFVHSPFGSPLVSRIVGTYFKIVYLYTRITFMFSLDLCPRTLKNLF